MRTRANTGASIFASTFLSILLALATAVQCAFAEEDRKDAGDIEAVHRDVVVEDVQVLGDGGIASLIGENSSAKGLTVSPEPSNEVWKFALVFDQNVAYTDSKLESARAFLAENETKVHLRRAGSGEDVGFAYAMTGGTLDERKLIYVHTDDWLDPFTEYEIVADAGIVTASGTDELKEPYRVQFRTSGLTRYGFTVQEAVATVLVVAIFAVGVVVGVVRMRRRSR